MISVTELTFLRTVSEGVFGAYRFNGLQVGVYQCRASGRISHSQTIYYDAVPATKHGGRLMATGDRKENIATRLFERNSAKRPG